VQALGRRTGDESVPLLVVTDSMQRVFGTERVAPGQAAVLGPVLVVGKELEHVTARSVDVVLSRTGTEETARGIVTEALIECPDSQVALRDGRRWALGYGEIPQRTDGAATVLRDGGVYIISGGLGGLGLELADDFTQLANVRLALLSRSVLPPREHWEAAVAAGHERAPTLARLLEFEARGSEVATYGVDVTDAEAVREVIAEIRRRFGPSDGVVHAAGIPGGGMMVVRKREDAEAVLAPKVRGGLALLDACGPEVGFFAAFSSILAVSGDYGQADYVAANSVLDRIAHARAGGRPRVVSIDWSGWREVGMLAASSRRGRLARSDGPLPDRFLRSLPDIGEDTIVITFALDPEQDWFLAEHRFDGTPVMPGTAYLEVVRAAFTAATGSQTVEIADVVFIGPLTVSEPIDASIALHRGDDWWSFSISRPNGAGHTVHAQGRVRAHADAVPPPVDLAKARSSCSVDVDARDRPGLMTLGAHWLEVSNRLQRTEDLSQSVLELTPDVAVVDDDGFWLHPAMLDLATSYATPAPGPANYLPFGYRRVVVHRPMPRSLIALRTHRLARATDEFLENDILVLDRDGQVCVEIEGYGLRRAEAEGVAAALAQGEREAAVETRSGKLEAMEFRIGNRDGVEIFRRILANPAGPQVIVCPEGLERRLARVAKVSTQDWLDSAPVTVAHGTGERFLDTPCVAPDTELEEMLAELWSEALGLQEVGVEDDFFDLGGSSLVAVQLLSRIRDRLSLDIGIALVFESPTVRALARGIEKQLIEQVAGLSDDEVAQALETAV